MKRTNDTTGNTTATARVKKQNKAPKEAQRPANNDARKESITMKKEDKDFSRLINADAIEGEGQGEKYMWLDNSLLQISPDIQRKLDPMRVAEIVANFDPKVANPVKVSFRDGGYNMFDGMHTRTALCKIHDTDNFPIFCRVYYGLTKEDEAKLFATQFGIAEAVPMGYRLRALEVAKDQTVLGFLETTKESGFSISLGSHSGRNGQVAATCQAFKSYCELGNETYGKMMRILHRTWAGESWSVSKYMLAGMTRFMKMYEFKDFSFIKAFREVTQKEIVKESERFPGMSKDGAFASALATIFDRYSSSILVVKPDEERV